MCLKELRQGRPWETEDVALNKRTDLNNLTAIVERDPALASRVASMEWVRVGPTAGTRPRLALLDVLSKADTGGHRTGHCALVQFIPVEVSPMYGICRHGVSLSSPC